MKTFAKIALTGALAGSMAMAANGDGYKMSVCSSDKSKLCYNNKEIFLNGMNIAWWNFSQDVGKTSDGKIHTLDENSIRKDLKDLRAAGGNSIRWWLFTNNAFDPSFDPTTHYATGIEEQTIKNVGQVLDIAEEYGIVVDLCLLSFDMMKKDYEDTKSWGGRFDFDANKLILEDEKATQAFIDNAVLPLVKAYKNHPALLAWEVFNEPEGMTSTENFGSGWGTTLVDIKYIQRVINMTADAIHKEAPNNLVSNGSARFTMTSDKCGKNYYTDAMLLAAGENKYPKGTLDFYQVHYYPEWNNNSASPFHNPYSYYMLDKPMVVGELPGADWVNVNSNGGNLSSDPAGSRQMTIADAYKYALDNGYAGALAWTLHEEKGNDFYLNAIWSLANSKAALTSVYEQATDKVKILEFTESAGGENGWMKVTYSNTDASEGANLVYGLTSNLTGAKNFTFAVKNESTMDLQYTMAIKTNADDKHKAWGWYNGNSYCDVKAGETATCTFPIDKFAYWEDDFSITENLGNIAQVIIKLTTDKFSGSVLIDDIRYDDHTINNFDTEFDTFTAEQETITKIETFFDGTEAKPDPTPSEQPTEQKPTEQKPTGQTAIQKFISGNKFHFANNTISISITKKSNIFVELISMDGKRVASLHKGSLNAGTHSFAVDATKGVYLVKVRGQGVNFTQKIVIK